jgi:hypothetical protein
LAGNYSRRNKVLGGNEESQRTKSSRSINAMRWLTCLEKKKSMAGVGKAQHLAGAVHMLLL